jgi:FixJ family two-component response regulator
MTINWRTRLGAILNPLAMPIDEANMRVEELPPEPVLVVDDDEDWGKECGFNLRTLGYEPLIARNPDEALALFMENEISIAIVDYNMPGQDGITLIRELSQIAEAQARKLHFIMASGYATKDVAIDAMRASAVDFLEKPIRQVDLRKALQRIKGLRHTPAAREVLLNTMSSLSSELQRLSQLIDDPAQLSPSAGAPAEARHGPPPQGPFPALAETPGGELPTPALADFIRDLLKKETKRRGIGGGDLFGDPAWEMLLDLLLAKIEGHTVSVSSACIASGAPMSTALRLVRRLVGEGVLCKLPDETDRRRHFLIINPKFEQPLLEYLSEQMRYRAAPDAG